MLTTVKLIVEFDNCELIE